MISRGVDCVLNHRLERSNSGVQLANARQLLCRHMWPSWCAPKGCIRPLDFVIVSPRVKRRPKHGSHGSHGQSYGPRAVIASFFASAWARCRRRFCVFVMAELCHQFSPYGVGCRSAVHSADGSTSLRCSLRIPRLCHGFGHGWVWSCFTRRIVGASTSPTAS